MSEEKEKDITEEQAHKSLKVAYEAEKRAGEFLLASDKCKREVYAYMKENELKHFDTETSSGLVRLQSMERTVVKYDIAKLKDKFNKKVIKEIIKQECVINDFDEFKKLMKKYKVPPEEAKIFFDIKLRVDNKRLNELYEGGKVTVEQLEGCYEVNDSLSLKIKELSTAGD